MIPSSPRVPGRRGDLVSMYRDQAAGVRSGMDRAPGARAPRQWGPNAGIQNSGMAQEEMVRKRAAMEQAQLAQAYQAQAAQAAQGGGMTSAVENTGGWQEAAPGARPLMQQAPQQPQTQPGGSWGFSGGYFPPPAQDQAGMMYRMGQPMQQAPKMTTTSVQPLRQQYQAPPLATQTKMNGWQAAQAAPQQGYNKMNGWQAAQAAPQQQGSARFMDPYASQPVAAPAPNYAEANRMQAVNSQYQQPMQREASHTGANPRAQSNYNMANQMATAVRQQIPRFAYGTDNSQAYANQGMSGAYIPTSSNQHAQGQELPPAIQALVNAGVPITPALLASVTGQANGQVNMGAAYTGLGGGTLASLQGIGNMTSGERENWGGFVSGPLGMREADTIEAIGRPTAGLQSAQRARN